MTKNNRLRHLVVVGIALALVAIAPPAPSQVGIERKVLIRQDLNVPGYETLLIEVTIAAGGREGKHSHPGTLVGYILDGELTVELDGQPTRTFKAGESMLIEPGRVHEGINKGRMPVKVLATFIVEKGKPLSTPAL